MVFASKGRAGSQKAMGRLVLGPPETLAWPSRFEVPGWPWIDWAPLSSGARPKRTQRLSTEPWDLLRLPLERHSRSQSMGIGVNEAKLPPPTSAPICWETNVPSSA
ncbi:hypothetical protein P7K49_002058 [Saguinus oedipus]|uniref:Uncharacterized protein n=1 Tax=Saguinus oedipus TaxID=9490 RepID=A0ABQ9WG81_SAGOE|nr:hypothetical protein P7K49_002058 [Saguinus oedipus]